MTFTHLFLTIFGVTLLGATIYYLTIGRNAHRDPQQPESEPIDTELAHMSWLSSMSVRASIDRLNK